MTKTSSLGQSSLGTEAQTSEEGMLTAEGEQSPYWIRS